MNYSCSMCQYWKEILHKLPDKKVKRKGKCTRYPPQPIVHPNGIVCVYPQTNDSEGCGEYVVNVRLN